MAIICPAILADTKEEYNAQIKNVAEFAERIQIDLTDGRFAPSKTVNLADVWWPPHIKADIHLMYQTPDEVIADILRLMPNMVIVHAEATIDAKHFAAILHKHKIKAGLAILPETEVNDVEDELSSFDHLLIFSGDLGRFGGKADLNLLSKIEDIKSHHTDIEIGWDGGVDSDVASKLAGGGVDVLNSGGFIQKAKDPQAAYDKLIEVIGGRK